MKSPVLKLSLIGIFFLAFSQISYAQKKYYNTQEEAIEAAYTTLNRWMESGEIREAIEKKLEKYTGEEKISGTFVYDITIRHKGEVISVNKIESDGSMKVQNYMKDFVKGLKFPFKMPKNKSYQFRYEFKF